MTFWDFIAGNSHDLDVQYQKRPSLQNVLDCQAQRKKWKSSNSKYTGFADEDDSPVDELTRDSKFEFDELKRKFQEIFRMLRQVYKLSD